MNLSLSATEWCGRDATKKAWSNLHHPVYFHWTALAASIMEVITVLLLHCHVKSFCDIIMISSWNAAFQLEHSYDLENVDIVSVVLILVLPITLTRMFLLS